MGQLAGQRAAACSRREHVHIVRCYDATARRRAAKLSAESKKVEELTRELEKQRAQMQQLAQQVAASAAREAELKATLDAKEHQHAATGAAREAEFKAILDAKEREHAADSAAREAEFKASLRAQLHELNDKVTAHFTARETESNQFMAVLARQSADARQKTSRLSGKVQRLQMLQSSPTSTPQRALSHLGAGQLEQVHPGTDMAALGDRLRALIHERNAVQESTITANKELAQAHTDITLLGDRIKVLVHERNEAQQSTLDANKQLATARAEVAALCGVARDYRDERDALATRVTAAEAAAEEAHQTAFEAEWTASMEQTTSAQLHQLLEAMREREASAQAQLAAQAQQLSALNMCCNVPAAYVQHEDDGLMGLLDGSWSAGNSSDSKQLQ